MNYHRWGFGWSLEQRVQLKQLTLILGLLLILFLMIGRFLSGMSEEEKEPVHIPVVRTIENVWIMEADANQITVYEEGEVKQYVNQSGYIIPEDIREQVADVTLTDEIITEINCKSHKINGKVLATDAGGIEVEGYGYMPLSDSVKGYRLYGSLKMCEISDLLIGYDFADFVLENNEICGILLVKEDIMEYIRVLIKTSDFQENLHEELVFTCDTDFRIQYGPYEQSIDKLHRAGDVCTVNPESELFQNERILVEPLTLTGKIKLLNVDRSQEIPGYRGRLELINTAYGIAVINEVLLEEYLYSVVPSEMPASYPAEALKAQAICARTYACRYLRHAGYPAYGAHVDDSTGYQVYNNIAEQEVATTAVKETYGKILTWGETKEPAQTYYYSTSCGIGTDAGVWNVEEENRPPYLTSLFINRNAVTGMTEAASLAQMDESAFAEFIRSRNEEDYEASESWYRWTYAVAQIDCKVIRERMISRRNVNPKRVLVLSDKEDSIDVYLEGKIENFNKIQDIFIASRGAGGVSYELVIVTDKGTYKVLTEYNIRYILCDGQAKVCRQDGTYVNANTLLPSGFFVMDSVKDGKNVTGYVLTGGGYGHGVGMSQNGARRMAESGMGAEDIARFFYQGCTILNVYEEG